MEVQANKKPIIIIYTTSGCEGCNMMISKVNSAIDDQIDIIGSINEFDVTLQIVNVINPKDFKNNTEKIYDFPTIQFIDKDNRIVATSVGVVTYEQVCVNLLKII